MHAHRLDRGIVEFLSILHSSSIVLILKIAATYALNFLIVCKTFFANFCFDRNNSVANPIPYAGL